MNENLIYKLFVHVLKNEDRNDNGKSQRPSTICDYVAFILPINAPLKGLSITEHDFFLSLIWAEQPILNLKKKKTSPYFYKNAIKLF